MTSNRYWRLDRHPDGLNFAEAFSLQTETLGPVAPGAVRVRTQWLSMDAGTRMWMTPRTDGYQPPLPLGGKMTGLCLGRITESGDARFPVGALARGFGQWAEYADMSPELAGLELVDESVADVRQHFGALGMNAWTAYAGVKEVLNVQPGEWLAVSAAAGATGSLVCQIGKLLGARVIGIAGGPDKYRYLREQLNVDVAIDYKNENVEAALARIDGGVNAYFENVGGAILDAMLPNMAHYGRIAICGLVASYDADAAQAGPARFDQILMRRLRVEGFFIPDFLHRGPEFLKPLRRWYDAGQLQMRFEEFTGLDATLDAYAAMMSGRNIGKVIVRVHD